MENRALRKFLAPLALAAAAIVGQGCYGTPYVEGSLGVDVGGGPPGVRSEVRIASPGVGYAWVPGYWDWNNHDWFWVSGAWQRPPHPHARWIAPRYRHRHGRWQYYRGHWN